MLSRAGTLVAAGAGLCIVGYCLYFDRKRRSAPDFKKKLREKRRKQKQGGVGRGGTKSELPDLRDPEAMQRFFMQEVQLGEQLLGEGSVEEGVEHLSNAVAVCGQPQQLLSLLQQTLPAQVFQMLLARLPIVSQNIIAAGAGGPPGRSMMGGPPAGDSGGMPATLALDDDLE